MNSMEYLIRISETKSGPHMRKAYEFLKMAVSRYIVGHYRYGAANVERKYAARMRVEYNAYLKTGNKEHLVNIAVYALLEFWWPMNPKAHFNPHVDSVTRGKF